MFLLLCRSVLWPSQKANRLRNYEVLMFLWMEIICDFIGRVTKKFFMGDMNKGNFMIWPCLYAPILMCPWEIMLNV
jgi:hypothetical protein